MADCVPRSATMKSSVAKRRRNATRETGSQFSSPILIHKKEVPQNKAASQKATHTFQLDSTVAAWDMQGEYPWGSGLSPPIPFDTCPGEMGAPTNVTPMLAQYLEMKRRHA